VIDELARCPNPRARHAELRERGAHPVADGRWVVATADDVAAVLDDPRATVGFAPDPARPIGALQARMARFTDGPEHAPRRAAVARLLAGMEPDDLRREAAAATTDRLAAHPGPADLDVMTGLARRIPVAVLARALGAADPEAAVDATAELAAAVAPTLDATPPASADSAITTLTGLLAGPGEGVPVAAISLLFQAVDATAALIGHAAARLDPAAPAGADALLADALRLDGPVQLTTRLGTAPIPLGDRTVPAGVRIVVVLAAAATDPAVVADPGFGFGHGPHACPGAEHAVALAAGVLDALIARGARALPGPLTHEPRLNLRVPRGLRLGIGQPSDAVAVRSSAKAASACCASPSASPRSLSDHRA
jgi:cytochrome P450